MYVSQSVLFFLERAREGEYELQHSLGFYSIAAALN